MKKYLRSVSHKPRYILGVNESLGAAAALMKDDTILAAALEERFTRVKNHSGFPKHAINFCLDFAGIKPEKLDLVVLSYKDPYPHFTTHRASELTDAAPAIFRELRNLAPRLEYYLPPANMVTYLGRRLFYQYYQPLNKKSQISDIAKVLNLSTNKIVSMDHHLAHAYTAYFCQRRKNTETLVLTCDGAGDGLCATVSVVKNHQFKRIASTRHIHSPGLLYSAITTYLGLKAHEDEYKVMGLAPYGQEGYWQPVYKLFTELMWVEGLEFKTKIPARHFDHFLKYKLKRIRFDFIAAAVQKFFEDLLVLWVKNAINHTKIAHVSMAGGAFLNVKANQQISNLKEIKTITLTPSPGDDTNAIGSCFYGYRKIYPTSSPQPLPTFYLGPDHTWKVISANLKSYKKYKITRPKNINRKIARLLSQGEVVARFASRMEFGARALGNRSILADPRNPTIVEKINRMIKMRDFWMPFAPTILDTYANQYLLNPKKLEAGYMVLSFNTTTTGKKALSAAVHSWDKSVRPQILKRTYNSAYYDLISEFAKLTGVGAILNTSFNIHGQPIVCSPADALFTFSQSGLKYLQLENVLISK